MYFLERHKHLGWPWFHLLKLRTWKVQIKDSWKSWSLSTKHHVMVSQKTIIFSKIIILDNSQSIKMWSKELLVWCDPRTFESIKRQPKNTTQLELKDWLDKPGGAGVVWGVDLTYKIKPVCWCPPWRDPDQIDVVHCGNTTGHDYQTVWITIGP